jgi:hypothetical protein
MSAARRLLATSIALSQFKAGSIGSGEDYVYEKDYGSEDQTPDEAKEAGRLSDLLKFKSTGYTDIDGVLMMELLLLPLPLTALLSTKMASIHTLMVPTRRWQTSRESGTRSRGRCTR